MCTKTHVLFPLAVSVIESVLQKTHTLAGCRLIVEEKPEEKEDQNEDKSNDHEEESDEIVLEVSGFKSDTSEDTLSMYFESTRRSGGGEVVEVRINEAKTKATVKFVDQSGNIDFYVLPFWGNLLIDQPKF